jgi:FMN-dependent NADH-azoreductase
MAYRDAVPSLIVDVMNIWDERLPEFDNAAIDAKDKVVAGTAMNEEETRVWDRIQTLVSRFKEADRIGSVFRCGTLLILQTKAADRLSVTT